MATNNAINNISNPITSSVTTVDPGASGDAYIDLQADGGASISYRYGAYDTDDSFRISVGTDLTNDAVFIIDTDGNRLLPLHDGFLATVGTDILNVTGDNTRYTVIFDTVSFDTTSAYDNTTGVFTSTAAAKLNPRYLFVVGLKCGGISTSHNNNPPYFEYNGTGALTGLIQQNSFTSGQDVSGNFSISASFIHTMVSGDTMKFVARYIGGSKTVDILAGSFFGGFLVF